MRKLLNIIQYRIYPFLFEILVWTITAIVSIPYPFYWLFTWNTYDEYMDKVLGILDGSENKD